MATYSLDGALIIRASKASSENRGMSLPCSYLSGNPKGYKGYVTKRSVLLRTAEYSGLFSDWPHYRICSVGIYLTRSTEIMTVRMIDSPREGVRKMSRT